MDYQQLLYLKEVVRAGNISQTADKLFISRQTISAALSNLERELGYPLLTRKKSGVELTEDGKLFFSRIESFFQNGDQLMQDMKDYGRNYRIPLRIGMTPGIEYPPFRAVGRWQDNHPEYHVTVEQLPGKESTERLLAGSLDVVITQMPSYGNSGFLSETLVEYPLCLAVHKDNPLSRKERIDYQDLVGQTILSTTLGYGGMEYEGQKYMPYAPEQFQYIYTEDFSLIFSYLIYNQGVMLANRDGFVSHLDCVRMIEFNENYTLPVFMRISDQVQKKKEYDSVIRDLKNTLIRELTER